MSAIGINTLKSLRTFNNLLRGLVGSQNRRALQTSEILKKKANNPSEAEDDTPIQYSTSPAASWRAEYTQTGGKRDPAPWFQYYVVSGSTALFLIYFCILRESNDIDEIFDYELSDHFKDKPNSPFRKSGDMPINNQQNKSFK